MINIWFSWYPCKITSCIYRCYFLINFGNDPANCIMCGIKGNAYIIARGPTFQSSHFEKTGGYLSEFSFLQNLRVFQRIKKEFKNGGLPFRPFWQNQCKNMTIKQTVSNRDCIRCSAWKAFYRWKDLSKCTWTKFCHCSTFQVEVGHFNLVHKGQRSSGKLRHPGSMEENRSLPDNPIFHKKKTSEGVCLILNQRARVPVSASVAVARRTCCNVTVCLKRKLIQNPNMASPFN